ncbi:MAG: protein tyrosine phosphatase, partial [Amphiplicatus sp.]
MLGDHGIVRLFYDNSHVVAPGKMWRSFQPSPHHLQRWRDKGVKTIVNLRGDAPSAYFLLEEEACAKLGLAFKVFRVLSREAPGKDVLNGARKLFREIEYPAVMHCKSGADRVGLMSTLYLFYEEGWPLDKAMTHLSLRYGHVRQGKTGAIDHALEQYIVYARREGIDLASPDAFLKWVDEVYDHVA